MAVFRDMPLGPERYAHYRRIVEFFFGPGSALPYIWTKRAIRMAKAFCSERVVYVSGSTNSGKTRALAIYLFVSWLCDPSNAKAICVSTGIESAQHRVWGDALALLNAMPVNADGSRVGKDRSQPSHCILPTGVRGSKSGLFLMAAGLQQARTAQRSLQGFGVGEVGRPAALVLGFDEGPGIAEGAFEAFYTNLRGKSPKSQLLVLGNFENTLSIFGRKCEPDGGWDKVSADDEEWRNSGGDLVLHFDGLQSENWLAQENIYEFELKVEDIKRYYDNDLIDTFGFWMMIRSFPAPASVNRGAIFNEADMRQFKAMEECEVSIEGFQKFLGLDPAFGGEGADDAIATVIAVGTVADQLYIVVVDQDALPLDTKDKRGVGFQLCDRVREICQKNSIKFADIGFDSSDNSLRGIVAQELSHDALQVPFWGGADDYIQSDIDPRPNSERFVRLISQMWGNSSEFMRGGHLRQIGEECAKELCGRRWATNIGLGGKQQVESKKDYRKRTGKGSPDRADSLLIAIHVALTRMNLRAGKGGVANSGVVDRKELLKKLSAPFSKGVLSGHSPRKAALQRLLKPSQRWAQPLGLPGRR